MVVEVFRNPKLSLWVSGSVEFPLWQRTRALTVSWWVLGIGGSQNPSAKQFVNQPNCINQDHPTQAASSVPYLCLSLFNIFFFLRVKVQFCVMSIDVYVYVCDGRVHVWTHTWAWVQHTTSSLKPSLTSLSKRYHKIPQGLSSEVLQWHITFCFAFLHLYSHSTGLSSDRVNSFLNGDKHRSVLFLTGLATKRPTKNERGKDIWGRRAQTPFPNLLLNLYP